MSLMPTTEDMRARFVELTDKVEACRAKSAPIRKQRDELIAQTNGQIQVFDETILGYEEGLFDMEQERAMISRALGGKTGE